MQPMMCILRYTYMARVCKIVLLKKLTSSLVIWTWLVTWSIPVKSEGLISYQPNIYLSKLFNVLFIMILISIEKGNTNVNLEKSSFFVLFERDNAFPNSVLMGARRNNK